MPDMMPDMMDESSESSEKRMIEEIKENDNDESGNTAAYWNYLESSIYKAQLYSKYASLVEASTFTNKVEKAKISIPSSFPIPFMKKNENP